MWPSALTLTCKSRSEFWWRAGAVSWWRLAVASQSDEACWWTWMWPVASACKWESTPGAVVVVAVVVVAVVVAAVVAAHRHRRPARSSMRETPPCIR